MTKALPVKDLQGNTVKGWSFRSFANVWNCGGNLPRAKKISGWTLTDPEGTERNFEGNWLGFVPYVQMILSNHDCTSPIS